MFRLWTLHQSPNDFSTRLRYILFIVQNHLQDTRVQKHHLKILLKPKKLKSHLNRFQMSFWTICFRWTFNGFLVTFCFSTLFFSNGVFFILKKMMTKSSRFFFLRRPNKKENDPTVGTFFLVPSTKKLGMKRNWWCLSLLLLRKISRKMPFC